MKRTGAASIAALLVLTACGGGELGFDDLSRSEQVAFDVFDGLGSGMDDAELACVVRELDEAGVPLPRDEADLAEMDPTSLRTSEVGSCVDDGAMILALTDAFPSLEEPDEPEEPEEAAEGEPEEATDDEEVEEEAPEGEDFAAPTGDVSTLTALSPALLAAAESSDVSSLTEALDLPDELLPPDQSVIVEATGSVSYTSGEITTGIYDLVFFAEDHGDDGQRFLDALLDADFAVDSEGTASQDGFDTESYQLSRGRDNVQFSVGSGGELEGILVVTYNYTDGTAQATTGQATEHGWVGEVNLPDGAEVTRMSSGYRPPFFALYEPRLQLMRSLSVDIPGDAIDDVVELVREGEIIDGLELRHESEMGDGPDDNLSITLRTSRDDDVRVSFFPSSIDDGYRMSLDATVELPDLEPGSSLDDAPEPDQQT